MSELREQLTILGEAPALLASRGSPRAAAEQGTVLLLHGLNGSKEVQRKEAHSLAERGYLSVTLDAVGHGDRRYPDFEQRFSQDRADESFFTVVRQTAGEIPAVLTALEREGLLRFGRVGACGISMGGAILFGAIVRSCAFDAAVTLVASPSWRHTPASPHQQLDQFFPTPLLIQTAAQDSVVPPGDARALHDALAPRYRSAPDRLRYIEHPGEGHMFSAPGWDRAWGATLEWFQLHMK